MITCEENEQLCRVGRGTVMGDFLREFWTPALLSSELERDAPPTRLMLFGEKLIAFRDTQGRVGIMDHRCPHRCASLFFGRNEEGGIRCGYHGWKFDVEGNCLDQPNLPDKNKYPAGVKSYAYKVTEQAGIIFVYMGKRAVPPPMPNLEALIGDYPDGTIALTQRDCNWLQALEGDVDTSHLGFLHMGGIDGEALDESNPSRYTVINKAPQINVTDTAFGTMYSASREAGEGEDHHRFACFVFPFWVNYPGGASLDKGVTLNGWVPIDDYNTMIFNIDRLRGTPASKEGLKYKDGKPVEGLARPVDYLPTTSDWQGRWRARSNLSNDYHRDLEWMKRGSYTGIRGVPLQDQAIQESMDPIVDRTMEHLGSSDRMVMLTRRRLLEAAIEFRKSGKLPEMVDKPELCEGTAGGDIVVERGTDWLDVYEKVMTERYGPNRFRRDAAE